MWKNGSIRKIRLISKFMTSQSGKQTIAINTLPKILRSKGNQSMKFTQLIEYNMKNIILEKSYTKCGVENISRPFPEKSKLSISLDVPRSWLSKYIETKLQTNCFYLI